MRLPVLTVIITLILLKPIFSQSEKEFKKIYLEAEAYFQYENEYELAVPLYLSLHDIDPGNANINYKIGVCYLSIAGKKTKAISFLETAEKNTSIEFYDSFKETRAPPDVYYYLGYAYQINNQLEKAIEYYKKFKNYIAVEEFYQIDYVNQLIQACKNAERLQNEPIRLTEIRLPESINAYQFNFNPVISGDDSTLVYTAKIGSFNYIFVSTKVAGTWTTPRNISNELATEEDCVTSSLSFDGKQLFLYKNDGNIGNIYVSDYINGQWTAIRKLNKNINTKYWESHASISPDGTTLYFSSNRKGGYGGLDIYCSELTTGGDWGPAKNLGSKINTPYNEDTPFITSDGRTIFFCSQGHFNMGGFDIFYSEKISNRKWSVPLNIGYPINTTDNNSFYVPVHGTSQAYYAHYSDKEYIRQDIYKVILSSGEDIDEIEITGTLELDDNKQGLDSTFSVAVIDTIHSDTLELSQPDPLSGDYSLSVLPGNYKVIYSGEGYKTSTEELSIPETFPRSEIVLNPAMVPVEVSTGDALIIKNILFDYDDYFLSRESKIELEKLFRIMVQYSSLNIEVIGHTDSRGTNQYNIQLSQKRSASVIEYLVNRGISNTRFKLTGAGESQHVAINVNPDGTDNPEGRKWNRRVNIKLLNPEPGMQIRQEIYIPDHLRFNKDLVYSIILFTAREKFFRDYFQKYKIEELDLVKPFKTLDGYIYVIGIFKQKTEAIQLLHEIISVGFDEARIVNQHEIYDLTYIGKSFSRDKFARNKSNRKIPVYTIQIHALENPVDVKSLTGLDDVRVLHGKDNMYRYISGEILGYSAAKKRLTEVQNLGYNNAFIKDLNDITKQ